MSEHVPVKLLILSVVVGGGLGDNKQSSKQQSINSDRRSDLEVHRSQASMTAASGADSNIAQSVRVNARHFDRVLRLAIGWGGNYIFVDPREQHRESLLRF